MTTATAPEAAATTVGGGNGDRVGAVGDRRCKVGDVANHAGSHVRRACDH